MFPEVIKEFCIRPSDMTFLVYMQDRTALPAILFSLNLPVKIQIAGIKVDEEIIKRYEGADRARGEELAVEISTEFGREIAPYVDGYYLVTPFGRTGLIARILDSFRQEGLL